MRHRCFHLLSLSPSRFAAGLSFESESQWIARSLFSSSDTIAAGGNRAHHYPRTDAKELAASDDVQSFETTAAAVRLGPLSSYATTVNSSVAASLCCDCICFHYLGLRYDRLL